METPPNTGPHRLNYMHYRRGEGEEEIKNDPLSKFGPSTPLFIQSTTSTRKTPCPSWLSARTSIRS
jgi:hypothetical protein